MPKKNLRGFCAVYVNPCGSFCDVSQRKGEEIVEEMKERDREERGIRMKVKKQKK